MSSLSGWTKSDEVKYAGCIVTSPRLALLPDDRRLEDISLPVVNVVNRQRLSRRQR